ncbi:glycosyltransferase family 2 protein [Methanobrevibacter arboriphilus]|uniref:glycosyltransferase family 2 protein n=1 Tax=Methanobrevibacter arboriphilus TaxID=39441 RepID=UPI00373AF4BE
MPAYNVEEHISDTLDSILNQSFQNFEVIIINDGSTDSTQKIIDKYSAQYSNIKSIIQENQGVAIARNNALGLAEGEYIGFLDPDGDLFAENSFYHINETIEYHESKGEIPDLVIGQQTTVDTWSKRSYKNAKELSFSADILPHDERIIWTMLILNKMFRREKILETGVKMPILTHASDAGFFFSFLYSCKKIVGCPHDFLIYKKRLFLEDSSLSQDSNLNSINSYFKSYEIILKAFNSYCIRYRNELKKIILTRNYMNLIEKL